jgi:NRAMP (natural resistance-associated macrophage protein)-like metal ion transporter
MVRPHHHRRARLHGHGYFKRLGPGLVTGAADDDPSGIGTYSQVGAAYGLALIWSTLAVAPMAAAVQEMAARLGLVTGRGLATLIRERFPRPVLFLAVSLTVVANVFNIGADLRSMAAATRLLVPVPELLLAIGFALVIVALELLLPYHRYSRILRWLALSLVAYVVVVVIVDVDWSSVVDHLLVPQLPDGAQGLTALLAVFGTTVSPYLFFWQASEEVEEELDAGSRGAPVEAEHLRAMRIDVVSGMGSAVFVAFCIMVAAATTLHVDGITTIETADQAARALEPAAGRLAELVFALGIVGLGLLAVPVLAGATAYALAEAFHWREGLSTTLRQAPGFYVVLAMSVFVGLLLPVFGISPIQGLYYSAILNGLVAPPLIVLMLLISRSDVLGPRRSKWLSTTLVGGTALVSIALPVAILFTR